MRNIINNIKSRISEKTQNLVIKADRYADKHPEEFGMIVGCSGIALNALLILAVNRWIKPVTLTRGVFSSALAGCYTLCGVTMFLKEMQQINNLNISQENHTDSKSEYDQIMEECLSSKSPSLQ